MTGYYKNVTSDLKPGYPARSSDINSIQSAIDTALTELAIDVEGPAVVLGGDPNSFILTPTPEKYDQINLSYDPENEWVSIHEKYLRQRIKITKSEINSITTYFKNLSSYTVTVFAEIRSVLNNSLIAETNAKLPKNTTEEKAITFNFEQKHINIGDYYFIIRPISISSIDTAINGDETVVLGTEEITSESFQIKFDANGTYTQNINFDTETNSTSTISGLMQSYNGVDYNDIYTDVTSNIYCDLCFREQFASTSNTYTINPGIGLILGQKVYMLDTHICVDGPSNDGNRVDLVCMRSSGQVDVIKGNVTQNTFEVPVMENVLPIAYIMTYKNSTESWTCPYCNKENVYSAHTCRYCGEGINEKIPILIQDDTNGWVRPRDLREEIRRLKKYTAYSEDRNAPSRIHYNCVLNAIQEENADEANNLVLTINDNGEVVYTHKDSTVQQYYWSFKDFDGIVTSDKIIDMFSPSCDCCKNEKDYVAGATVSRGWSNYCPNCQTSGSLIVNNISDTEKEIKCLKCDTKYCGFCGGNKKDSTTCSEMKLITAGGLTVNKNGSTIQTVSDGAITTKKINLLVKDTGTGTISTDDESVTETTEKIDTYKTSGRAPINDMFNGQDCLDTSSTDGIDIDTENGTVKLKLNKYDDEFTTNAPVSNDYKKDKSYQTLGYTIRSNIDALGQQQSEFPALNFELSSPIYLESLIPQITEFNSMENFGILLFKNDVVFNPPRDKFICYTKHFSNDETFPNVYQSEMINIKNISQDKEGNQRLDEPHEFPVHMDIPAGKYTLLVYGTPDTNKNEGKIFIDSFQTIDPKYKFGTSMTCRGPSTPSVLYIEPTAIKDYTWDLLVKRKQPKYAETGTLYSQTVTTNMPIRAVSASKTVDIPDGCSIKTYVSNNGGRTYTEIQTEPIKFSGTGKSFKWKLVLGGNGTNTPTVKYNDTKGFAVVFNVGESVTDTQYSDYKHRLETRVLDAGWINANLLGDAYTYKNFGEWEFARLWAEENDGEIDVDIFISYFETPVIPVTASVSNTHNAVFWSTVFADLKLSDFSQASVDYSVNDTDVEYDEHNYRMDLDTEVNYNEGQGTVIAYGVEDSATDGTKVRMGDINSHTTIDKRQIDGVFTYTKSAESSDTQTYTKLEQYMLATYQPTFTGKEAYYCSIDEIGKETYSPRTVIIGKAFPNGIDMTNYTQLSLSIIPILPLNSSDVIDTKRTIPAGTLEVVVSLNTNGSIDELQYVKDDNGNAVYETDSNGNFIKDSNGNYIEKTVWVPNATYGKTYTINQELKGNEINEVNISGFRDDVYAYGNVKSIGIRVKDVAKANTLKCVKDTNGYVCDGIGIASIKLKSDNINSVIPGDNSLRKWKVNEDLANADISVGLVNNPSDDAFFGLMEFNIGGDNVIGDIATYEHEYDPANVNWYYVSYYCTDIFPKGEFTLEFYADTAGETLLETLTLPAWDYVDTSSNAEGSELWARLWASVNGTLTTPKTSTGTFTGDPLKDMIPSTTADQLAGTKPDKVETVGGIYPGDTYTNASPGHSYFVGAWFKRRSTSTANIQLIKLVRNNVDDDGTILQPKDLIIQTIRGYRSKTIPSFGPKLKMRIYPNADKELAAPNIRKFGVVYTLS